MNPDHQRQLLNLKIAEGGGVQICTTCYHDWKPNAMLRVIVLVCAALLLMTSFSIIIIADNLRGIIIGTMLLLGSVKALTAHVHCPTCKSTQTIPIRTHRGQVILREKMQGTGE
jgi:Co/Zn/Cd efflux system component